MSLKSEFKEFISKGNVIDLAVGVVIGAAFGKIVTSLVEDVLMPPIGILIGGVNFSDLKLILQQATVDAAGNIIPAVTINYGNFIQVAINFLIIAFTIFLFVVKPVNAMKKKQAVAPAAPPAASKEEILLAEIRDLLKSRPV
jgi:large conductance mechanosensitive channel